MLEVKKVDFNLILSVGFTRSCDDEISLIDLARHQTTRLLYWTQLTYVEPVGVH